MNESTFIKEVAHNLQCDERRAEDLIFAVFQELRNRLTPYEAAAAAAQMPSGLKRLWQSLDHSDRRIEKTHQAQFIEHVRTRTMLPNDWEARQVILAVFRELQRLLGSPTGREGEAWDIYSQLPKDLKNLWVEAGAQAEPR